MEQLIEDANLRDQVQRLWLAWTDEADADGLTDFYGLQAMVAREMFELYVETQFAPTLQPGDVIILHNLSSH